MKDEFYIGWEKEAPPGIGRMARRIVLALLLLALLVSAGLAVSQRLIGSSVFEYGEVKKFSGIFQMNPYPHLLVPRPGITDERKQFSSYYLVAECGDQTMIQVADNSLRVSTAPPPPLTGQEVVPLGRQTLRGEIVDSKCYLGVMNPGQLTPHRACAIRCISGGIPPVLLLRSQNGPAVYLLLVSANGKPVNQQVLDYVAEPVEITGEVERQGDFLILRADPAAYLRIKP